MYGQISITSAWSSTYNSHTIGTGTNRLLVYIAPFESNPATDLTSVSYGGQPMTLAIQREVNDMNRVEIWYLKEVGISASLGSTFTTTFDNGLPNGSAHYTYAVTLDNVDQATTICQAESGGTTNSTTVNLDNALNLRSSEMSIYATSVGDNVSHTPHAGYTENYDNMGGTGWQSASVNHRIVATSGVENPTASFSVSPNRAVICSIRILPDEATCSSPLPIELLDFNVKRTSSNKVKLDWKTASEINNDYFTVERSRNGTDWEEIQKIDGAGNSSHILHYSIKDENPYSGISYYHLKQTDFDGQFEYSYIRSIQIDKLENEKVELYPNPTSNLITLKGSLAELEKIVIYNVLGQNVTSLTQQIEKNETTLLIDLSKLNQGIYYVKTKTTANKVYKQ